MQPRVHHNPPTIHHRLIDVVLLLCEWKDTSTTKQHFLTTLNDRQNNFLFVLGVFQARMNNYLTYNRNYWTHVSTCTYGHITKSHLQGDFVQLCLTVSAAKGSFTRKRLRNKIFSLIVFAHGHICVILREAISLSYWQILPHYNSYTSKIQSTCILYKSLGTLNAAILTVSN